MNGTELISKLRGDKAQQLFTLLYGKTGPARERQIARYTDLIGAHEKKYGAGEIRLFSSPGRSEIGGNHTDHNLGKVLAASIQLDCIGAVTPDNGNGIGIYDLTYNEDYSVPLSQTERISGEKGSIALVRGILQGFKNAGYKTGGFKATFTSDVIAAAGVSSSASFEMMICAILNYLYNNGEIPVNAYAAIGQFAENKYWDKSSGQLDQMACAFGGLIAIDFEKPGKPQVEKINFDFTKENYSVIIVNTGKSHADLSREYSSIPQEMKAVAKALGKETLREVTLESVIEHLGKLRTECSDRAVLRAFHFLEENKRVDEQVAALKHNDFKHFLNLINDSGDSSWKWLQNTIVPGEYKEQSIPVALALTELFFRKHPEYPAACRIHGGGFAGVILALVPAALTAEYTAYMNKALTGNAQSAQSPVYVMAIRPVGSIELAV